MRKMDVVQMGMLRWMCNKTRKIKIINERFQEHLGIASSIGDKIRETCLRWFRHVYCKLATFLVRKRLAM